MRLVRIDPEIIAVGAAAPDACPEPVVARKADEAQVLCSEFGPLGDEVGSVGTDPQIVWIRALFPDAGPEHLAVLHRRYFDVGEAQILCSQFLPLGHKVSLVGV